MQISPEWCEEWEYLVLLLLRAEKYIQHYFSIYCKFKPLLLNSHMREHLEQSGSEAGNSSLSSFSFITLFIIVIFGHIIETESTHYVFHCI